MIPCCGSSFCDECVRTALLESEDNECPDCHEKGSSPGSLIPNRFLRNSVNSFKNETGYNNKPRQLQLTKPIEQIKQIMPEVEPVVEETIVAAVEEEVSEEEGINTQVQAAEESAIEDDGPHTSPVIPLESEKREGETEKRVETAKSEAGHHEERDESDVEDNITVTVPPAHQQSRNAYRDRQINGQRWGMRHEYDRSRISYTNSSRDNSDSRPRTPPSRDEKEMSSEHSQNEDYRSNNRTEEHQENNNNNSSMHSTQSHRTHHQHSHHSTQIDREQLSHPPPNTDSYGNQIYSQSNRGSGGGGYDNMDYNNMGMSNSNHMYRSSYDSSSNMGQNSQGHYNRGGNYHNRGYNNQNMSSYSMRGGSHQRHHNVHMNSLASVYQGVQAKVGTGIIDDPLEAFNRIMREKERRKEERRRSPNDHQRGRRSRSIEINRRRSMERRRISRGRSPDMRIDRARVPEERRRRSSSFSSRGSR